MNQKNIFEKITDRVLDFISQYSKESERAAVILCGAKIDNLLYIALQKRLLPNITRTDELLDNDRTLGTFSSRIHASFRLGIIDYSLFRVLHIFRKMRNDFAHEIGENKLTDNNHKNRISELSEPFKNSKLYKDCKIEVKNHIDKDIDEYFVYMDFLIATAFIIGLLELTCEIVEPLDNKNAIKINS